MLGVNARYWLGIWINRWASPQFPWATFTINVTGALAIGFLATLLARWSPHSQLRLILVVGFLGGYTTFSTFAFESVSLGQRGEWALALANMVGSVAAACVGVLLGAALATGLVQPAWNRLSSLRESRGVGLMTVEPKRDDPLPNSPPTVATGRSPSWSAEGREALAVSSRIGESDDPDRRNASEDVP
jgi:CrcB protein